MWTTILLWLGYKSEVQMLEQSLKEKDEREPGWDRAALVAGCTAGLEDGADRTALLHTYGDEIFGEAEAALKDKKK